MENEQKYKSNLNKQYEKSLETSLKLNSQLLLMRNKQNQYEMDNKGHENQLHHLKNKTNQVDQQLLQQQEIMYHQDFLKKIIDRRLTRLLGEKTTDKHSELELKIHDLRNEYENKKHQYEQLQSQIKILNEELRIIKRDLDHLSDEKNDLNEKFLPLDLHMTISEKLIKKLNSEKEVK